MLLRVIENSHVPSSGRDKAGRMSINEGTYRRRFYTLECNVEEALKARQILATAEINDADGTVLQRAIRIWIVILRIRLRRLGGRFRNVSLASSAARCDPTDFAATSIVTSFVASRARGRGRTHQ